MPGEYRLCTSIAYVNVHNNLTVLCISRFLIPISSPFGKLFEREVRREEKEVIKGKEEKGKKKAKGTKI